MSSGSRSIAASLSVNQCGYRNVMSCCSHVRSSVTPLGEWARGQEGGCSDTVSGVHVSSRPRLAAQPRRPLERTSMRQAPSPQLCGDTVQGNFLQKSSGNYAGVQWWLRSDGAGVAFLKQWMPNAVWTMAAGLSKPPHRPVTLATSRTRVTGQMA